MVSRRTGHFVQVFKPIAARDWHHPKPLGPKDHRQHPNYVTVEGRTTSRTVTGYPPFHDGWFTMSRELPRRKAIKYAKAYRNAGFNSRVTFQGQPSGWIITDEFAAR